MAVAVVVCHLQQRGAELVWAMQQRRRSEAGVALRGALRPRGRREAAAGKAVCVCQVEGRRRQGCLKAGI